VERGNTTVLDATSPVTPLIRRYRWKSAILASMQPSDTGEPKVVFNTGHIWRELVPIPRRMLTEEEMEWVRQSLRPRAELANFSIPQLFAISKCPCGTCRTVGLEPMEIPNWKGKSGKVGGMGIQTKDHGPIDILLHANHGFLVELEVIWYNFPQPFPKSWEEVSRMPDPTSD